MHITSLAISDLRILVNLKIEPCPGINFLVGDNGAGKTSVLEAIYLVGRGRSFRHADAGPMIRQGADNVTVVVEAEDESSGRHSILGVRREKKNLICRLNGEDIRKRSVLAEALPVQWIGSQPQLFLGLGPEVRRRFIDMGLFHVEHSYLKNLAEFQRNLRQRNAAIRNADRESALLWNKPLADSAERIHGFRCSFVDSLMKRVAEIHNEWTLGYVLEYRYRSGWNPKQPLLDQLNEKLDVDLKVGYTSRGPQRAELELTADGGIAEKNLSRGQQKLLVLALNLSFLDLMKDNRCTAPVLMIDDLAAELDPENRNRIMHELESRGGQVFLTKIEDSALKASERGKVKRFHVEHGALTP